MSSKPEEKLGKLTEEEKTAYNEFIEKYQNFPKELYALVTRLEPSLSENKEDENYNQGTMHKRASENIVIANGLSFKKSFDDIKKSEPNTPDDKIKSQIALDFLKENGGDADGETILFGTTTRKEFVVTGIFDEALKNTNFLNKNIGDMQILFLEPKSFEENPRNTEGPNPKIPENFKNIPDEERLEIIYKRGLYHESIHMALSTTDERKCDAFALLKVMKEHPDHAKAIFDIYNIQRSKAGHVIHSFHKNNPDSVEKGTMTYLMPKTYEKLKEYAEDPGKIPASDEEILKLACEITAKPDFTKEQLTAFSALMKENITLKSLKNSEIIQSCMKQGGFTDIVEYIKSDKKLQTVLGQDEQETVLGQDEQEYINKLRGVNQEQPNVQTQSENNHTMPLSLQNNGR